MVLGLMGLYFLRVLGSFFILSRVSIGMVIVMDMVIVGIW